MYRWLVILAVVGALWPVGVGAAPRGTYQTVAPGKGADAVYEHLADPCTAVMHALLELGVNPLSADERVRELGHGAAAVLLPVLEEVAEDPTLADDPYVLRGRIRDQVAAILRGEYVYNSPTGVEEAVARILVAALSASFQEDLWRGGFGPPPAAGQLLLRSIMLDFEHWLSPVVCSFAR